MRSEALSSSYASNAACCAPRLQQEEEDTPRKSRAGVVSSSGSGDEEEGGEEGSRKKKARLVYDEFGGAGTVDQVSPLKITLEDNDSRCGVHSYVPTCLEKCMAQSLPLLLLPVRHSVTLFSCAAWL